MESSHSLLDILHRLPNLTFRPSAISRGYQKAPPGIISIHPNHLVKGFRCAAIAALQSLRNGFTALDLNPDMRSALSSEG
jgi:hypothetical protein